MPVNASNLISVSVIVVSYNTSAVLRDCLLSLRREAPPDAEIIVVDNASDDGSPAMVQAEFPEVVVIETGRNLGFAGANNRGLAVSRGRRLLLLNSDTVVLPGALEAMAAFLDTNPKTGAVGCRLLNLDGSLQKSAYKFPSPARALAENLLLTAAFPNHPWVGDFRAWPHDRVRDVDFVIGAALMVRREVLDTVGGLDEGFFMYAEETDWCRRMREAGWATTFLPHASVVHLGGGSSRAMPLRQFVESNRSALRYIRKHHGPVGEGLYRAAMLLGAGVRLPLWGAAWLVLPGRRASIVPTLVLWRRLLRWYGGFGPHEGLRELASAQSPARVPRTETL